MPIGVELRQIPPREAVAKSFGDRIRRGNLQPPRCGEFAMTFAGELRPRATEVLNYRRSRTLLNGNPVSSVLGPKSSHSNSLETLDSRFKHSGTTGGGSGPQISKRTRNSADAIEFLNVSFTKRGRVRPMAASTVILNLRGPLAANSPRCEASKFSSDERREFPAAPRLQFGHCFPATSLFNLLAIKGIIPTCARLSNNWASRGE